MSENPDRFSSAKMAGNGWTRPQAMRKDQNRTAWLVLFGLVCLGVATWGVLNGIYWKRRERVQHAALDAAKRESDSFVAITYGGVSTPRSRSTTWRGSTRRGASSPPSRC